MKSAALYFVSFLILISIGLPKKLAEVSQNLRSECSSHLSQTQYHELNSALICGTNLQNLQTKNLFQFTGLIHLIVVSGSHLIFLQQIIAYFLSRILRRNASFLITALILLFFTLMTGLQPPCVRAFVQLLIGKFNQECKLFWRPWHSVFISGLICLSLFPEWLASLSLLMSWACAFALSIPTRSQSHFKQHVVIYFILLPVLSSISIPHPFVILVNFIFAPIFGMIVFPMALISAVLPYLNGVTDQLWRALLLCLEVVQKFTPPLGAFKILTVYQWGFLFILHLTLHFIFMKRSQRV